MNAERLKALITVIDTGSLSEAARRLDYTPSGISRMMAALDEEFGFPLLMRGRDGTAPTRECLEVISEIREYLHIDEVLRQKADAVKGLTTGTVIIGNAYNGAYPLIEKAIAAFTAEYPGIKIQLVSGFTSELLARLDERTVDLAVVTARPGEGEYRWKILGSDEMVAWVPGDSRYAENRTFPIGAFAQEPYIDQFPGKDVDNNRILNKAGVTPNVQMTTFDSYAAWTMVEAGMGVAMNSMLNSAYMKGTVRVLPLDPPQSVDIGIASKEDCSPAAERFLEYISQN